MNRNKLKITENRQGKGTATARFSLSFPAVPPGAVNPVATDILEKAGCEAGLLVEIDPSLIDGRNTDADALVAALAEQARAVGAPLRMSTIELRQQPSFFDLLVKTPPRKARLVRVLLSPAQRRQVAAQAPLPACGIRYFALREPCEPETLFDEMELMSEARMREVFRFTLFDMGEMGQVGLDSAGLTIDEVRGWFAVP